MSTGTITERETHQDTMTPAGPESAAPPIPMVDMNMCLSPQDGYQVMVDKGVANSKTSILKTLTSSTLGGFYVAMGGMLSLAVAGNIPGVAANNPGFIKWIFAALFPVNLLMALMTGSQLFT